MNNKKNNHNDQNNNTDRPNDNINHDQSRRRGDKLHGSKSRLKSSIVRDPNGSSSTFKQFYQSGGRDYEQYQQWLQTLSKPEQLSTSAKLFQATCYKTNDIEQAETFELPRLVSSSLSSTHSRQSMSTLRFTHTYPLVRPIRPLRLHKRSDLPIPTASFCSSLLATASLKNHLSSLPRHPQTIMEPTLTCQASCFDGWSVADVARFIEKNCSEKNIARKFMQQEIDGRTLPLLTEDHLMRIFNMKLGPALQLLKLISNMQRKG